MDMGPQKIEQKTTTTMEMRLAVRPHEFLKCLSYVIAATLSEKKLGRHFKG